MGTKLKLFSPCRVEDYKPYSYSNILNSSVPYGMGVLTAFLKSHNYYVEQEDLSARFHGYNNAFFPFGLKNADLIKIIINEKEVPRFLKSGERRGELGLLIDKILGPTSLEGFQAIGFSVISFYHFLFALVFSRRIKQIADIPIIFGGSFISLYGQLYPEAFNFIDYMVVGDGRIPLLRLIDYLDKNIGISEVPNLIYSNDGKLTATPREYYPIEDMPMPDFNGLPMELYRTRTPKEDYIFLPYQISRGCTGRCSFCNSKYIINKLEFKSHEKVISELSQMKERYKSRMFRFCDDAINNSYEYLEGLCNIFIKNKLNIKWSAYAKAGNLDKHILVRMKEAGCQWLKFGIESGSDKILRMMNKDFSSEQASQILKDSYETGLINVINFVVGFPCETQTDIEQTVGFIRKNKKYIHYIVTAKFSLEQHSSIYADPERYGVENLTKSYPNYSGFQFYFDESRGLRWKQKQKQQEDSRRQITKAICRNIWFKIIIFHLLTVYRIIILKIKRACSLI